MNRAVGAVSPAAIGKQIEIDVDAPAPVIVVGDPSRMQQVVALCVSEHKRTYVLSLVMFGTVN